MNTEFRFTTWQLYIITFSDKFHIPESRKECFYSKLYNIFCVRGKFKKHVLETFLKLKLLCNCKYCKIFTVILPLALCSISIELLSYLYFKQKKYSLNTLSKWLSDLFCGSTSRGACMCAKFKQVSDEWWFRGKTICGIQFVFLMFNIL